MLNRTTTSGPLALMSAVAAAVLLAGTPGDAAGAAAQGAPCPSSIQVDGRTAVLTAFVCGTATVSVGTPWPISIGVTVGHCTGCECGYVWEGDAGSQFTRRGVSECGLGSPGNADDDPTDPIDEPGCQWGRDYIGWEPREC